MQNSFPLCAGSYFFFCIKIHNNIQENLYVYKKQGKNEEKFIGAKL